MGPMVTLPAPECPAEGLSGYVFPMLERQAPFGLIIFSVEPGACTETDFHKVHEYWLVTAGNGELIYDGETYGIKEGDLLYFEPQKQHQVTNNGTDLLKVVSFDWHGES